MRTLQCHAGPILVRIGVALRLPGPISAGGGVRGSESGCNINLKKVLQGNAAGKCASQPLRATSAAQPKGCSGSSVPRAGTTSPQEMHFLSETGPNPGQTLQEMHFLPKSNPVPGETILAPQKKCTFSPKVPPFRDKLPPERLFLPESHPNPGQTLPAPPKKCISSPKATPIRDKSPEEMHFLPETDPIPGQILHWSRSCYA